MNIYPLSVLLGATVLLTESGALSAAPMVPDSSAIVTAWLRTAANPIRGCEFRDDHRDLECLRRLVGNGRIVSLGDATCGTHEFLSLKHRILEYLATEMGFRYFAIEVDVPDADRVDEYIRTGRGDPRVLLRDMGDRTWQTAELLEIVKWMRAFNAAGRGPIRLAGFDMQLPDGAAAVVRGFCIKNDRAWADSAPAIAARIRGLRGGAEWPSGSVNAVLPAALVAGHHLRLSGFIRLDQVSDWAGLYVNALGPNGQDVAFDNMATQRPGGTRDWRRYAIELDVPSTASRIQIGAFMVGSGRAWFDSLALEIDGKVARPDIDLSFESAGLPQGFQQRSEGGASYAMAMVDSAAASGRWCLRIAGFPSSRHLTTANDWQAAEESAASLLRHLEARREALSRGAGVTDTDRAIHYARLILQAARMRDPRLPSTFGRVRASSMADNVAWILDHAGQGSRIVVWARDWQASRRANGMGSFLAKRYGRDYVPIGFTTGAGRYLAYRPEKGLSENDLLPPPEGSIEAMCRSIGLGAFVVDLRTAADPAVIRLLGRPVPKRSIGSSATTQQFSPRALVDEYDGLIYVDRTEAARLLER